MGTTSNLFQMDPQTANSLLNFGFSTMAASQTPGITTLAALGKGGIGMNEANAQQAQTQNQQQEGISRKLNNAMTLRGLNLGNSAMGLNPVTMSGVPDLLNQQNSNQPSGSTAGYTSSASAGGSILPTTRTAPNVNNLVNPQSGITQEMLDVAMQKRAPQDRDEAIGAARVAGYLGNAEWQKELTSTAMEGLKPSDVRPGGSRTDPLGGTTTVNPAHIQNVEGNTVPFAPAPVTYNTAKPRNAGQGFNKPTSIPSIPDLGAPPTGTNPPAAPSLASDGTIPAVKQGVKTGWSPQETETQKNYFGKETESYNGAVKSMANLQLMQHSIDTLNEPGSSLSTGSWGERKLGFAKALQSAGVNIVDPNEIAAGESLLKTTGRLGFDMSKQLGAREPGVITQQAIKLNPGIENTPQGVQLLHDSVKEEAQRIIDEHNYKGGYYQNNGYNQQKAEANFDQQYPPALYAQRATSQTSPISVNNPAAAKQLLAGTKIKTPKGIKAIPAGVGITPPSYQSVIQPQTPINIAEPEAE